MFGRLPPAALSLGGVCSLAVWQGFHAAAVNNSRCTWPPICFTAHLLHPPSAPQVAVQQLLVTLHDKAAEAGSATGALQVRLGNQDCPLLTLQPALCSADAGGVPQKPLSTIFHRLPRRPHLPSAQVARCREFGLLVPQDHAAAFKAYAAAAKLGSAEGALRCGIHYFEGTAPGGGQRRGLGRCASSMHRHAHSLLFLSCCLRQRRMRQWRHTPPPACHCTAHSS